MSINNKLVKFSTEDLVLARTAAERERIDRSLTHLEGLLLNHFGDDVDEILRFGSYTRNTILPRRYDAKSDVDLMIVFNSANALYKPRTYRKWLADFLSSKYSSSFSKKDLPSVRLELDFIMYDIVPAYRKTDWFGEERIYIPESDTEWMQTNPNDINSKLKTVNVRIGQNSLRNTIRLCKYFNASSGYPYQSYILEKSIIQICDWQSWNNENTYQLFMKVMNHKMKYLSGVEQTLNYIKQYDGGFFTEREEEKQLLWLNKLLPGINS